MSQYPEMEEQNAGSLDCRSPLGWALLFMGTVPSQTLLSGVPLSPGVILPDEHAGVAIPSQLSSDR